MRELREILSRDECDARSYDRGNCVDEQRALSEQLIDEVYSFQLTEADMK